MNPATLAIEIAIVLVILVVGVLGIKRFMGSTRGTRDCCSGELQIPRVRKAEEFPAPQISDTNPDNYPHHARLEIAGMTCEHCVRAVTRALDSKPGVWASVELMGGQAELRSKEPISEQEMRDLIERAGYQLRSLEVLD